MKKLTALAVALACAIALWPAAASGQSILVFDENSDNGFAMTAVTDLGYTYTRARASDFVTLLTTGTVWDLVIVDLPSTTPSGTWETALSSYVTSGGACIATCWLGSSVDLLAPAFEFTRSSDHDAVNLYRWDTTHAVFTVPNSVPDITSGITDSWGTNGPFMTATGTGVEVAGSTTTPSTGQAMIVVGNGGRTIFNGFLFDDYGTADNDSDGTNDCIELIQNEISMLIDTDVDRDGDGWTVAAGDCNDWDPLIHPGVTTDPCDGADNDCDPSTEDGSSETWFRTTCDGTDTDLCEDGLWECIGGTQTCTDDDTLSPDICDGEDNDCDPTTPDGSGDPLVGEACDGDDPDLCAEGTWSCVSGSLECSDTMDETPELCDGVDNDCDPSTIDGIGEDWYLAPCDGSDADLCEEGTYDCISGVQVCDDTTGDIDDLCNTTDEDCDPTTPDGEDEEWNGDPCDGADLDLCAEGTFSCVEGVQTCDDFTDDNTEVCNGVDDDCNPATSETMDNDGDGISACGGDCDDRDPTIYPGAPEICADGIDQDCDPNTDHDGDGDGYYDCDGDCQPTNPAVNPGATEICDDGVDNDCDGFTDSMDPLCLYDFEQDAGCGCSMATGGRQGAWIVLLLLAAACAWRFRRR